MMVTGRWRASQAASQFGHNSVSITQSTRGLKVSRKAAMAQG